MGSARTPLRYSLDCPAADAADAVEHGVVAPASALGYRPIDRGERTVGLRGMRRPRWAIVLAIFLFPIGLPLLLVRRPRELLLSWNGEPPVLAVRGDDPAVCHLAAQIAIEHERPASFLELTAPCFAAGAVCVLVTWVAAVQLIDPRPLFVAAIVVAIAIGSGIGTVIGMRRAAAAEDPRNPIVWGTLPALVGGLAMTAAFVALVLILFEVGAGE